MMAQKSSKREKFSALYLVFYIVFIKKLSKATIAFICDLEGHHCFWSRLVKRMIGKYGQEVLRAACEWIYLSSDEGKALYSHINTHQRLFTCRLIRNTHRALNWATLWTQRYNQLTQCPVTPRLWAFWYFSNEWVITAAIATEMRPRHRPSNLRSASQNWSKHHSLYHSGGGTGEAERAKGREKCRNCIL